MTVMSRYFLLVGAGILSCFLSCAPPNNASFPSKNLTLICPWAAGGGTDRVSRFFAGELEKALGRPVVVSNRTGGGGAVGHHAGASARPDGHTLLMGTFELSTMHWMGISSLTHADYTPLLQVNADPAALIVRQDSPWKSVENLVEAIRAAPGTLKMSGTATGGAWDVARAGFQMAAGLKVSDVLWVPTEGSAPSLVELLGGHIDVVCCSLPEAASQIASGQLRPLAVMAEERVPGFAEVPTVREAGIAWEAVGWRGMLLPRETPAPVVDTLRRALQEIAEGDAYRSFMEKNRFGHEVRVGEAFREFLAQQDRQWQAVIEAAGYAK
jgi:tripartite-type tricarboxylate transporter receptor subunit TctC